jgi:GH15 family glucan-1,4-alpha-glucosidase
MSNLIEEYGLIGDGETAALVHRNGSVDWLCLPRFDSDACFAALLGTAENGCWKLAPVEPFQASHSYIEDTLVLQTEFETSAGAVRVTDFMPIRQKNPALIRMVQGLRGCVKIRSAVRLCFDYGSVQPWLEIQDARALARVGPDLAVLYTFARGPNTAIHAALRGAPAD